MSNFSIDKRLLADCHRMGRFDNATLLLNRNAALPWFIVVPDTELEDVLDFPKQALTTVLSQCSSVSAFIKKELGYPKVNFAGLGNVVPQMHLHIIGRRPGDACWPQPVWGNLSDGDHYALSLLKQWQDGLVARAGLQATPLD